MLRTLLFVFSGIVIGGTVGFFGGKSLIEYIYFIPCHQNSGFLNILVCPIAINLITGPLGAIIGGVIGWMKIENPHHMVSILWGILIGIFVGLISSELLELLIYTINLSSMPKFEYFIPPQRPTGNPVWDGFTLVSVVPNWFNVVVMVLGAFGGGLLAQKLFKRKTRRIHR